MFRTEESLWLIHVITTALWVPLRPHDPSFYTSTLLCCSSPYIFISPCSLIGISQLCDTPPSLLADLFPVRYLTPTRIPHLRSNLFLYLFSDHTTCPLPFFPSLVSSFPDFICYDHIRRVLCTLLCVCPSILDLVECYRLLIPRFYGVANDTGSHSQLKLQTSVGTERHCFVLW